jgi:hypothetical protein
VFFDFPNNKVSKVSEVSFWTLLNLSLACQENVSAEAKPRKNCFFAAIQESEKAHQEGCTVPKAKIQRAWYCNPRPQHSLL